MLVEEKNALTSELEELVAKFGSGREALLPILQAVQIKHAHISDYAQQEIARLLDIHPVEVYSVITFYAFLSVEPKGKNIPLDTKRVIDFHIVRPRRDIRHRADYGTGTRHRFWRNHQG